MVMVPSSLSTFAFFSPSCFVLSLIYATFSSCVFFPVDCVSNNMKTFSCKFVMCKTQNLLFITNGTKYHSQLSE